MNKPSEMRNKLFKVDRPNIRPISLQEDMGILWAAYLKGSFPNLTKDLTQEQFSEFFLELASAYTKGWIVEDKNKSFAKEYGATGLIFAVNNEWELEPHYYKFKWATDRNNLRTCVGFFQMMRYDKSVGVVQVHTNDYKNMSYFKRLNRYGVLNYVGTIPHGDIGGDRHIFYVRGKKKWVMTSATHSTERQKT